ncbi:MAG: 2-C-methyl-D-erythritol 4-phosphate cytidylyltransferase [Phycisphaeraceae bacterium]|nr:2-C-methyl-D-erythritol 4-phosphate cytidylyltransferase [Phycisphaeraceae bacterium]
MKTAVIIPAAGRSERFFSGSEGRPARSKIELDVAGRPAFLRSVEIFADHPAVDQVLLAVDPGGVDAFIRRWGSRVAPTGAEVVAGGEKERWETVSLALEAVHDDCSHVAVHDAARPLTSRDLVDRILEVAMLCPAVIPAVPVAGTLKRVSDPPEPAASRERAGMLGDDVEVPEVRTVEETVDRTLLYEAQTPQVFEIELLRSAYQALADGEVDADQITDDAGLIEALGHPVRVVEGESTNFKITRPHDLRMAEAFCRGRADHSMGHQPGLGDDADAVGR